MLHNHSTLLTMLLATTHKNGISFVRLLLSPPPPARRKSIFQKYCIQRLLCTLIKFHEVLYFGQDFYANFDRG